MGNPVYGDRVQETFTTTGTGAISLGGAVVGYQPFSAVAGNAQTCYYGATDGTNWEIGLGTYTSSGDTLARTTILASSNANAAVNWLAGTKSIWLDLPAAVINNPPTRQVFTTAGSGTYTTPANVLWLEYELVGGGNGGNGSGTSAGTGGTAGATVFGAITTGTPGGGGQSGGDYVVLGGLGMNGDGGTVNAYGGYGGGSYFASPTPGPNPGPVIGNAANAPGGGGSGASCGTTTGSGNGGVGGTYVRGRINAPAASYSYTVGAGGAQGTAGTNGLHGGAGYQGMIIITEHYGA